MWPHAAPGTTVPFLAHICEHRDLLPTTGDARALSWVLHLAGEGHGAPVAPTRCGIMGVDGSCHPALSPTTPAKPAIVNEKPFASPRGHLTTPGDIFCWRKSGRVATGIQRVEARDVAPNPRAHRAAPTRKGHPAKTPAMWGWDTLPNVLDRGAVVQVSTAFK